MIIPSGLIQKHDLALPYIKSAGDRVRDVVQGYCETEGLPFLSRIKATESLAEKIETGRFPKWSAIDDAFACCIIVPTLDHEPATLAFLRSRFLEIQVKGRGTTHKDPSVFRFDATRFIGRLDPANYPTAGADVLSVSFEVQIRTAFEHAWSVTTHALTYKGDQIDWRRLRLAAQLKASVEQLDALIIGFDGLASSISEQNWPDVAAKRQIEEFFRAAVAAGRIPSECQPLAWSRFCENLLTVAKSAHPRQARAPESLVSRLLSAVDNHLKTLSPDRFPRSISLIQFCIGALVVAGEITGPLENYTPFVSDELLAVYPETRVLGAGFDLTG